MSRKNDKRKKGRDREVSLETSRARSTKIAEAAAYGYPARWPVVYMAGPVVLAILGMANTLWNRFASDDTQQVLNNALIRELGNLPRAFTTSVWSFVSSDIAMTTQPYYRPLFSVLFTLNYALFGQSAWGWHLVNVLIHAVVTLLVFIMLREIVGKPSVAATAAGLFALHPAHAESVAWISGITDAQMALFILPSFYFYMRYRSTGNKRFVVLALAFYLLGLMSKETALALPLVVAYCELFYFGKSLSLKQRLVRAVAVPALFIVPTAVYVLIRANALGAWLFNDDPRYPLGASLATTPIATVKYLVLMAVPTGYSYQHYTQFVDSIVNRSFLIPVLVLAILAIGIKLVGSRLLAFAALWFGAFLVPALAAMRNFDPEYIVQERYLYLPSIGFCLAIALGLERLAAWRLPLVGGRAASLAVTTGILAIWGVALFANNRVWRDSISLFQNCIAIDARSGRAHAALAGIYYSEGRPRQAEEAARRSLDLDPRCSNAYLNLSYFSKQAGRLDEAIRYLEQAEAEIPVTVITRTHLATILLNLGLLYDQRGDAERASKMLRRSLELWPRAVGWYYTGQHYFDRGQYEDALAMFEQTRRLSPPGFAPVHLRLAWVYDRLGLREQARSEYASFIELAPPGDEDREQAKRRLAQL